MAVPTWVWVAGIGGVGWYVYQQNKIKLAANSGVTRVVDRGSIAAGNVIDEAGSALGRFFGGLFSGGGSSSTSDGGSASWSSSGSPYSGGGSAAYQPDFFGDDRDYGAGE